jgi:hypothetical protein
VNFVPQKYKDCERKCFIDGGKQAPGGKQAWVQEEANELHCGDRSTESLMDCPM